MTNTSRKSLQEGTRSGKGEGSHNLTEGDSTEIPYKLAESFLKNNQNKNKLNEYLYHQAFEGLHQHTYYASYQAGYFRRRCVEELDIPDSEQWGRKTDTKGDFQPL